MNYKLAHDEIKQDKERQRLIDELKSSQRLSQCWFQFRNNFNRVTLSDKEFTMIIEALENVSR